MEFMAGTGMTPEKEEALERAAELCAGQADALDALAEYLTATRNAIDDLAGACAERAAQRRRAASEVMAKIGGTGGAAALAEVSSGNWLDTQSAERAALVADKLSQVASLSESEADRRRAELSDILYHLTN